MKKVIIFMVFCIVFLLIWGGTLSYFFSKEYQNNKELRNNAVKDSIDYVDLMNKTNDVSFLNITLRNLIDKNNQLERELLKDTNYINISSKYN